MVLVLFHYKLPLRYVRINANYALMHVWFKRWQKSIKTPANVTDFGEAIFKQARKNLDAITLWRNG